MSGFDTDLFRDLTERFIFQGGSAYGIALADYIDQLRAENEKLKTVIAETRIAIKQLQAELKAINVALDDPRTDLTMSAREVVVALKAELAEQARIVGMGAERELALLAKVEWLKKKLATLSLYKSWAEQYGLQIYDDLEQMQKDAKKWREREAKIKSLKERGFLRSPLRSEP